MSNNSIYVLGKDVITPDYISDDSAGLKLYQQEDLSLSAGETVTVDLKIRIDLSRGFVGFLVFCSPPVDVRTVALLSNQIIGERKVTAAVVACDIINLLKNMF